MLCTTLVWARACLFASFLVSWSMQQVRFRSTHKEYTPNSYSYCKKLKKIQWKLYWGNCWNDRMECGRKVFAIVESWLLRRSFCPMLKCSCTKEHISHDKNRNTRNYFYKTKPQKPQIAAREKDREKYQCQVCSMCYGYVLNEIKHLIANHRS